jgi:parallel beta-helix repeat protein
MQLVSVGGVYCDSYSSPTLTNCILWGDTTPEISGTPLVSYSDVQGGWTGTGNVNINPGFAFADDFHLLPGSPCIDVGTNSPIGDLPTEDADGNPRALDGNGDGQAVADIGAYEFNPVSPAIASSPSALEAFAYAGGPNPAPRSLSIRNSAVGILAWQITEDCSWLNVNPSAGNCQQEIDSVVVSFDIAGLPSGEYFCVLNIDAPQAANNPRDFLVMLHLGNARHVPAEYPTIQAAINAAVPRDWVLVADGVWTGTGNKDLDLGGKAITVRGLNGLANCVIDCEGSGRGFYFHSNETPAARVEGFTIRGASAGGVFCYFSSPAIADCMIAGNAATYGGGLYCRFSSVTLTNCTINGNTGGGVYCDPAIPTLTNCTINGNTTTSNGGGVCCSSYSSPTLTNCTISGNTAHSGGGGVFCHISSPTLTNCTISGNVVSGHGSGGGVYCEYDCSPVLTNCTISRNTAVYEGGGLYSYDSSPTLTSCILWGDTPREVSAWGPSTVLTYCDIQGGWSGIGNIDADPLFLNPLRGNYRLLPTSPCIDTGDNAAVPTGVLTDLDGKPRVVDGNGDGNAVVDMGAYEYQTDPLPGDLDGDDDLDYADYSLLRLAMGRGSGAPAFNPAADLDQDGCVTLVDYQVWIVYYRDFIGDPAAAPPRPGKPVYLNHDAAPDAADTAPFVKGLPKRQ